MRRCNIPAYIAAFNQLKSFLTNTCQVVNVMANYKIATHIAAREVFNLAKDDNKPCFFHFNQACLKNAKKFKIRRAIEWCKWILIYYYVQTFYIISCFNFRSC